MGANVINSQNPTPSFPAFRVSALSSPVLCRLWIFQKGGGGTVCIDNSLCHSYVSGLTNSPKIWTFLCCCHLHLLNPSHPLTWKNFFYLPLRCKLVLGEKRRSRNMSRCFETDCKVSTEYLGKAGVCRCRAAVHFSASVSDAGCITVQPFPFVFLLLRVSHTNGGRNTCGDSRNGKKKEGRIVFAAAFHSPKLGDNPPALHLWGDRGRIFHSFSFLPL